VQPPRPATPALASILLVLLTGLCPLVAQTGLPPVQDPQPTQEPREGEPEAAPADVRSLLRKDLLNRSSAPALRAELALQRRLLAEDLLAYADVRDSERERWRQVDDLKTALDLALAEEELLRDGDALTALRTTEIRLASALGEAENASERSRELRDRIVERVRKIHLVESQLSRLNPEEETVADPLTGRWRVTLKPDLVTGTFDLVLDGTTVTGRFGLSNGRRGSLRGTFTGRSLRLEALERDRGLDAVYDGTLDREQDRITGFWRPMELAGGAGGSGGGDWWAEPAEEPASPEEIEATAATEESEEEVP